MKRFSAFTLTLTLTASIPAAEGQTVSADILQLPTVVVHTAPSGAGGIDIRHWPAAVHTVTTQALTGHGPADFTRALASNVPGLTLAQSQGSGEQPDILYHGFEISPIQGTPAGLSVYVDGERFNAPFGDIAPWQLLPAAAIASVAVQDSNPAFGLNALGGAIDVRMKNGFTDPGGEITLSGGSFGRLEGDAQYGGARGNSSAYVDISGHHETGWRDSQDANIAHFYGDAGWRGAAAELHVSALLAGSTLNTPGTSPEDLLNADRAALYTGPNTLTDRYAKLASRLEVKLSATLSLSVNAYVERLREQLTNGNGANDQPCGAGPDAGYLCRAIGVLATGPGGAPIPAYLGGAALNYGQLIKNSTTTTGFGATAQLTESAPVLGRDSKLSAGVSFDGGFTTYDASAYDGALGLANRIYYSPIGGLGYAVDEPGTVPSGVGVRNAYYGVYLSDTISLTKRLAVTAAGRLNLAQIAMHNDLPPDPNAAPGGLNGSHIYAHANPALGLTYQLAPLLTLYGGWAEENAAPTPSELACASPLDACTLSNSMAGDPALKQIVTRGVQAGLRGGAVLAGGLLSYTVGLYRSEASDAIEYLQAPQDPQAAGYFANIGQVQRQGGEISAKYTGGKWNLDVSYAYTEARYESRFTTSSAYNPAADANGNVTVRRGDALPGIAQHVLQLGVDYEISSRWMVGIDSQAASSQPMAGDPSNRQKPVPGHVVLNATSHYWLTDRVQIFATVENALNQRYETYGTFSPTAGTGGIYVASVPGYSNPRSYSPAAPFGVLLGVRFLLGAGLDGPGRSTF
ncbi:MAG: hypothetical protein B7Z80_20915 [Rhodospirillales bacterium 20-64-7]|nr:MAG: hypothetical protein B7Z80_20915 [Rhodospirillales bacterium 20-64-7]